MRCRASRPFTAVPGTSVPGWPWRASPRCATLPGFSSLAADSPQTLKLPSGSIRWVDSAFYEPAGQDTYVATASTVGPWSHDAQHGGPASALAARALERHEPDEKQRLARVAVDILRPIPVGKLSVKTRIVRPGRRITLAEVVMEADGQEVLHARGWRIERPAGAVPEIFDGASAGPLPAMGDGQAPSIFSREPEGYLCRKSLATPGTRRSGRPGPGRGSRCCRTRSRPRCHAPCWSQTRAAA